MGYECRAEANKGEGRREVEAHENGRVGELGAVVDKGKGEVWGSSG